MNDADLADAAKKVLRDNDLGTFTKAAPELYPHQWSWDSAFIAMGLAHVDVRRAALELESLFDAQWQTGMVPHIVFDPDAPEDAYFPGAEWWETPTAVGAPDVPTSGLCQPPVHAVAAWHVWDEGRRQDGAWAEAFIGGLYPKLFAWHRYLATLRDPDGTGLVTIYHPWESGTDNSPRWDAALDAVTVDDIPHYERRDLTHVTDTSQRPTGDEYDRYIKLVVSLRALGYDDRRAATEHPFRIQDGLLSALFVAANEVLADIAETVGAPEEERAALRSWAARGRDGLARQWESRLGLTLDYDLVADRPVTVRTVAGFAPLIAGGVEPRVQSAQLELLDSTWFCGAEGLRWPLPPSTSPTDPAFQPRTYWRGPVWPFFNWIMWWSLRRAGEHTRAEQLRRDGIEQIRQEGFSEYFEPFTGQPLGSSNQSWTAAVLLDWLAFADPQR